MEATRKRGWDKRVRPEQSLVENSDSFMDRMNWCDRVKDWKMLRHPTHTSHMRAHEIKAFISKLHMESVRNWNKSTLWYKSETSSTEYKIKMNVEIQKKNNVLTDLLLGCFQCIMGNYKQVICQVERGKWTLRRVKWNKWKKKQEHGQQWTNKDNGKYTSERDAGG